MKTLTDDTGIADTVHAKSASSTVISRQFGSRGSQDSLWAPGVLCAFIAAAVCMLGSWRLDTHSMEGIISLGGERMVQTGEWFVPRLYGTVYAYKPAMAYWLAGLSQHALGRSEFAMRLPTAVCGVMMCLVTFWVLARLSTPRCGLYAALAMSFSALFIEHGRIAGYDIPLALGVGIAMLGAARNLVLGRTSLAWWIAAYLGLTFAFLSKGLPAFGMFGPGLLVAALVLRQFRQLFTWQHLAGAAVGALAIGAYLYLVWREAGPVAFADQSGEVSHRAALWTWTHVAKSLAKPFIIWAVFLPGSALVPALPFLWLRYRSRMPIRIRRLAVALACFFLTGVVVWMAIPTENSRYYLPLIVSVAGLAGITGETLSPNPFSRSAGQQGGWSTTRLWGRDHPFAPGVTLFLVGVVYWLVFAGYYQPNKIASRSERLVAADFAPRLAPQQTVYFDGFDMGSSLFYYLQHPVGRWSFRAPPIDDSFALVIDASEETQAQREILMSRTDIRVEILATAKTGTRRTWQLARVSRER